MGGALDEGAGLLHPAARIAGQSDRCSFDSDSPDVRDDEVLTGQRTAVDHAASLAVWVRSAEPFRR
jgi:hypothetical protein